MPKLVDNKQNKKICSRCHKWCDNEMFYRKNWKNSGSRYFAICNQCDDRIKIPNLMKKVDELDKKFKKDNNFISSFNIGIDGQI